MDRVMVVLLCADGHIFRDGHAARPAWAAWTLCCLFIQRFSQVRDFPVRSVDHHNLAPRQCSYSPCFLG